MDKIVEDVIKIEATALAHARNIKDIGRVINIMKRTAMDGNGRRFHENREGEDPLAHGLRFIPSLDEALIFLPPDKAVDLFENSDVDELILKTTTFRYWLDIGTPFYTHQELAELTKKFTAYLKNNNTSLMSIGYPAKSFRSSLWFYQKLSRLYPVKIPNSTQGRSFIHQRVAEADNIAERDGEGNLIFAYTWVKGEIPPFVPLDTLTQCTYEEAPLFDGLTDKDVEHIEEQRARLFNLKIRILNIAYKYITTKGDYDNFWNECINAISDKLSKQDLLIFTEIEKKYLNLFLLYQLSDGSHVAEANPITGFYKGMDSGGIKNLFEFMFLVEKELRIGKMHNIKTRILSLIANQTPASYYQLVTSPKIAQIDKVIFESLTYDAEEQALYQILRKRLVNDVIKKFKIPLLVMPEKYDAIKAYAQFLETNYKIGIDVIGHFAAPLRKGRETYPIKLSPNTRWEDVTIRFLDGHTVNIKAKDLNVKADYKDMGFEDKKRRLPNKQWEFLNLLAESHGKLTWKHSRATQSIKKKKQLLSQTLKAYFQIDEDPFLPYKQEKAYKIRIKLIPE